MKAINRSGPLTRRNSASASSGGATGAVGWITVRTWVSQKSYTLPLAAFRNTALNTSIRSLRPTTVACLPPENSASERSAISTGLVRQPARATAKKFITCLSGCNPQPLGLVFGHAHGRSPAWRSSAPTIAPRISATFSRRRGLRRLLGEDSLERRVHLPPLSGGGRAVPLR